MADIGRRRETWRLVCFEVILHWARSQALIATNRSDENRIVSGYGLMSGCGLICEELEREREIDRERERDSKQEAEETRLFLTLSLPCPILHMFQHHTPPPVSLSLSHTSRYNGKKTEGAKGFSATHNLHNLLSFHALTADLSPAFLTPRISTLTSPSLLTKPSLNE